MFEAIGLGCKGRNYFKIEAFAKDSSGALLNPKYAVANFDADDLIAVTLTPAYDTVKGAEDHAVYVKVTDELNAQATNHFCFMVNKSPSTANFCRSICLDLQMS